MSNPDSSNPLANEAIQSRMRKVAIAIFGLGVTSVAYMLWQNFYPFDTDGDDVVNKQDQCPELVGVPAYSGCPDPDTDRDGFPVNIAGSAFQYSADQLDECPDKDGIGEFKGCPAPTPEEQAVIDFDKLIGSCAKGGWACDREPVAALAALPAEVQTAERKALAEASVQTYWTREVRVWSGLDSIGRAEVALAQITDVAKREELRADVARRLWFDYYATCNPSTNLCDNNLTRLDAFKKVVAFYDFDKAYPVNEVLVEEIISSYLLHPALRAASDQRMTEEKARDLFGLKGEDFTDSDCGGYKDGKFYGEAAKYGWFRTEAEKCVKTLEENYRFKSGIIFARQAGLYEAAVKLEQAAAAASIAHGEYSLDVTTGHQTVIIADREEWGGS